MSNSLIDEINRRTDAADKNPDDLSSDALDRYNDLWIAEAEKFRDELRAADLHKSADFVDQLIKTERRVIYAGP